MSDPSATSFLKLLERSGIVSDEPLKAELAKLSEKAAGRKVNVEELAGHLVDSGLITRWHTEKLLAGKYKGFFLGKFKLLGHLGSGGMSSVYLAKHKISDQFRAIKVLPRKKVADKSYLDRFYLEARAAASLNHPNVVRIYDICNDNNTHYMVMEYVKGQDLHEMVKEKGQLGFEEALRYCAQAADGLTHAHQRELVHRDIKPANLLKTPEGDVKILDLGLALVNQDDSESLTVLYNEKVMGTADYLSPEQAVNSHEVDLRADIYSLGCTLYFLLTGHPPFPDGTLAQRIAKHQTQEPADIRESRADCPEAIVNVCKKMMRKKAEDRYQTCDEIKEVLLELVSSGVCDAPVASDQGENSPAGSTGGAKVIEAASSNSEESSAFEIKTTVGSSKSHKSSKSRKPILPRKKVKAPPKWVLPVAIALMFIILITVLSIAIYSIRQTEEQTEESRRMKTQNESTQLQLADHHWAKNDFDRVANPND
ncbi:MAG: serine/threonine protein kinase [Mariniblastus sp.]